MEAVSRAPSITVEAARRGLGDWRLPILTGLVLAIVTAVPYVYGYAVQPHGQVFMGFFFLGDDANTYLAKMRQGWEGAWAWTNRYTTETSPSAYLFMFWILLGHAAALLHLPLIAVFHLARVAAAFGLMGAAWLFISQFIEGVRSAPAKAQVAKKTISIADLVGEWRSGGDSSVNYVNSSTGAPA